MGTAHLAVDLGASSGRAMLGRLEGDPLTLSLSEVHRFQHHPIETPAGPVWDLTGIFNEILVGIRAGNEAAEASGVGLVSIGVNTWGVDGTFVDAAGELLGLPHCYRDPQNAEARDAVLGATPDGAESLFRRSGVQPESFNTLFQLHARRSRSPQLCSAGARFLFLPDLFHYWLSGVLVNERTIASTSGLLSVESGGWDREQVEKLGLSNDAFGDLVDPGARLGPIRSVLAEQLGLSREVQIVAPATHDTASAVAATPFTDETVGRSAFLSSGTWSLLGVEIDEPLATPEALRDGFTNELGVSRDGGSPTVRFLRNIGGLWLVEELRRDLERNGVNASFAELTEQAEASDPFRTVVDPNASDLAQPGHSISKLRDHARATDQPIPETPGQLARCCLDSLALCYEQTVRRIESLTGRPVEAIHLFGGGSQNRLLNRLTASVVGRDVHVGPVEATATGNVLIQACGAGRVPDLAELRRVVRRSFPIDIVRPETWLESVDLARERYAAITADSADANGG